MEILMKKKNKWDEKYNQNNISQFYFEVTNFYTRNISNHQYSILRNIFENRNNALDNHILFLINQNTYKN